jgi:glucan phosphoethanolaminetransferase (alkaline phosphatase superfamily)
LLHPVFFFLNCPSTHTPYCVNGRSLDGQGKALQYVDAHIPTLIDLMPKPCHCFILADHGDCFGEDGLWGHNLYHEKVMEVPFIHFPLESEVAW